MVNENTNKVVIETRFDVEVGDEIAKAKKAPFWVEVKKDLSWKMESGVLSTWYDEIVTALDYKLKVTNVVKRKVERKVFRFDKRYKDGIGKAFTFEAVYKQGIGQVASRTTVNGVVRADKDGCGCLFCGVLVPSAASGN